MCDSATQQILEQIISDFVKGRKIFTALNVTRVAQKQHQIPYKHNDIKNETHRVFEAGLMDYTDSQGEYGEYDRALVPIPGINGKAWAYFPEGVNILTYDLTALTKGPIDSKSAITTTTNPTATNTVVPDPFGLNAPQTQSATVAPVNPIPTPTTVTPTATPTVTVKGKYEVDKRRRLWIPRQFIQALKLKPGSVVDVRADKDMLTLHPSPLSNSSNASGKFITSYYVDSHSNVAISPHCFAEAKLTASSYDILNMNNTLVIKKA